MWFQTHSAGKTFLQTDCAEDGGVSGSVWDEHRGGVSGSVWDEHRNSKLVKVYHILRGLLQMMAAVLHSRL